MKKRSPVEVAEALNLDRYVEYHGDTPTLKSRSCAGFAPATAAEVAFWDVIAASPMAMPAFPKPQQRVRFLEKENLALKRELTALAAKVQAKDAP